MLSKLDKKIISVLSKDLPLVRRPFAPAAANAGISEKELLKRLKKYSDSGLMRKFSAVVNHRKVGFKYNAMVVWDVPQAGIERAGRILASSAQVSHCYQRKQYPQWDYSLYSMVHGRTKEECLDLVKKFSRKIDCNNFKVLFSSQEYKKTPVQF